MRMHVEVWAVQSRYNEDGTLQGKKEIMSGCTLLTEEVQEEILSWILMKQVQYR